MQVVILAEKNKNKDIRIRQFYPYENKISYPVNIGDTLTIKELSPYPFEHFSSINEFEKGWKPTYLLVEAELSDKEWRSMNSSGVVYHRFANRKVTVLSEFNKPFEYGYERLLEFGKNLHLYDFHTWIIHQKTRSKKEFEAMSKMLEMANEYYLKTEYTLEVDIDKYTAPYMKQLISYNDNVKFDYRTRAQDISLLGNIAKDLTMHEFVIFANKAFIDSNYLVNVLAESDFDRNDIEKELFDGGLKNLLFFDVKPISKEDVATLKRITTFDSYIKHLIAYVFSSDFKYSPLDYSDNTLTWKEWLSTPLKDVPLYEEEVEIDNDYYNDDYDYDDDDYYNEEEHSFEDEYDVYNEEPPTETETKLVDVRVYWVNHVVSLLENVLTLDQIKSYMPYVHNTLWDEYVIWNSDDN